MAAHRLAIWGPGEVGGAVVRAVCAARPGILIDDPSPHYRHDDRIVL